MFWSWFTICTLLDTLLYMIFTTSHIEYSLGLYPSISHHLKNLHALPDHSIRSILKYPVSGLYSVIFALVTLPSVLGIFTCCHTRYCQSVVGTLFGLFNVHFVT